MKTIRIALLAASLALAGCAAPLYEWDQYDARTFKTLKSPNASEEFRIALETHLANMRTQKKRPAPGLYAELGTLYLQRDDVDQAVKNYRLEHDAWEESRPLMTALVTQLEKRGRPADAAADVQPGTAPAKQP